MFCASPPALFSWLLIAPGCSALAVLLGMVVVLLIGGWKMVRG